MLIAHTTIDIIKTLNMSPNDEGVNSTIGKVLDILLPIQPQSLGNLLMNWLWNSTNESLLIEDKLAHSITSNLEFLMLEMLIGNNRDERSMWAKLIGSRGSFFISP